MPPHDAERLHALSFNVIPFLPGGKAPATPWKVWQARRMTGEELSVALRSPCNIGIVCGELAETNVNVLGIDFDDRERFSQLASVFPESPMVVKTPRGLHAYYRLLPGCRVGNAVRIGGMPVDLKSQGGCLVVPPSFNARAGVRYEWVKGPVEAHGLPLFPVDLLPRRPTPVPIPPEVTGDRMELIARASRYCATIDGAVSGQGGHKATFRVACILMQRFGLTMDEAMPIFQAWNTRCVPPWSERDLIHKLSDAAKLRMR